MAQPHFPPGDLLKIFALTLSSLGALKISARFFKLGVGGVLFLVTRVPFLIVWSIGIFGWAYLLISGAQSNGKEIDLLIFFAISLLLGAGFACLTVLPVFMTTRLFSKPIEFPLDSSEQIETEVRGCHFHNHEARGGKIIVTPFRVGFKPNRFNVQTDVWSIPIKSILGIQQSGATGIIINEGDAHHFFTTMNPGKLVTEINQRLSP